MVDKFFKFLAWLHGGGKDTDETGKEWHSFWIGVSETFCFCIKPQFEKTKTALREMKKEWHWYTTGRVFGIILWVVIITSLVRMMT